MFETQRFSPGLQLALLLIITGFFYFAGDLLALFTGAVYLHVPLEKIMQNPNLLTGNAAVARITQVTGTFFMFGMPAIIFASIASRKSPQGYLGFNTVISGKQVFFVVLMFFAALLISECLGYINELIPLPKQLAANFRRLENEYDKEATTLLEMKGVWEYLLSLLVVALLPAMIEETLFRGCLQKIMISLTRNAIAGIVITSIVFSAVHMSYYGFLPRFFLGCTLGFIYYYSKNIWLSIAAHFLNNAFEISQMYAITRDGKSPETALAGSEKVPLLEILFYAAGAALILFYLFKLFKKESERVIYIHTPEEIKSVEDSNNLL